MSEYGSEVGGAVRRGFAARAALRRS
jgi:hypothetical protein